MAKAQALALEKRKNRYKHKPPKRLGGIQNHEFLGGSRSVATVGSFLSRGAMDANSSSNEDSRRTLTSRAPPKEPAAKAAVDAVAENAKQSHQKARGTIKAEQQQQQQRCSAVAK